MAVERVLSNLNLISFKTEEGLQNHIDELQDGDLVFTPDTTQEQLNKKADRDLNNLPSNYDYIVATQEPTSANGYTWFRKYKSGWVEQGGQVAVAKQAVNTILATDVSLPIIMSNAAYLVNATFITDGGNSTGLRLTQTGRNTTHITLFTFSTTNITNDYLMSWEIKGISA